MVPGSEAIYGFYYCSITLFVQYSCAKKETERTQNTNMMRTSMLSKLMNNFPISFDKILLHELVGISRLTRSRINSKLQEDDYQHR